MSPTAHNPDNLPDMTIGVDFRLLDAAEIKGRIPTLAIQRWSNRNVCWNMDMIWAGSHGAYTYRTKLSREELAKLP